MTYNKSIWQVVTSDWYFGTLKNPTKADRYCYIHCNDGYVPVEDNKSSRITCTCDDTPDSCNWVAKKAFTGCMGPCAEADRRFGNVKNAFKIVHDYSDQKKYFGEGYDALSVNLR